MQFTDQMSAGPSKRGSRYGRSVPRGTVTEDGSAPCAPESRHEHGRSTAGREAGQGVSASVLGPTHLILIFSTNTNCESMAYRSFSLSGFDARGVRKVTVACVTLKGATKVRPLAWLMFSRPGDTIKLPGHLAMLTVPPARRKVAWHRGETPGYGNNLSARDNRQPSPTANHCYGRSSQTKCWWVRLPRGNRT